MSIAQDLMVLILPLAGGQRLLTERRPVDSTKSLVMTIRTSRGSLLCFESEVMSLGSCCVEALGGDSPQHRNLAVHSNVEPSSFEIFILLIDQGSRTTVDLVKIRPPNSPTGLQNKLGTVIAIGRLGDGGIRSCTGTYQEQKAAAETFKLWQRSL